MKTALITGASAGLGLEFAKLFAEDGHSLILVARRLVRLQEIARDLKAQYPKIEVTVVDADLGRVNAGHDLFDKISSMGLTVDFLVNNAGFGTSGAFKDLPLAKELQMMDLNMRTLVELTHLFVPGMVNRKFGRILNVGSMAGFQPGPYMGVYYASKAFVNSFSEALHQELKGSGVTCTVLAPGATATEFADVASAGNSVLFKIMPVATAPGVAAFGYKSMLKGKAIAVPGLNNRLMIQLLRVSPRCMVRKLVARVNQ